MKQAFIEKTFSPESLEIVRHAIAIIDDYRRQGYKLSLRQLYYQLVSKNIVPNTEKSYDRIGSIITDARMVGLCDWDMIEDRNRTTVTPSHWSSPAEIIRSCANQYRIDKWVTQTHYCEVMVEKQALEGVLEPVCNELDIPFTANKGYSSVTMMYHAGRRLFHLFREKAIASKLLPASFADHERGFEMVEWMLNKKLVHEKLPLRLSEKAIKAGWPRLVICYMGDHDPSGIDMTRDVGDRLRQFSDMTPIEVRRMALNMDQIEELNPPENPAKMSDSRAADYVAKFGHSSWELDAVAPDAMAQMVRDAVEEIKDDAAWEEAEVREAAEKNQLKMLADNIGTQDTFKARKKKK